MPRHWRRNETTRRSMWSTCSWRFSAKKRAWSSHSCKSWASPSPLFSTDSKGSLTAFPRLRGEPRDRLSSRHASRSSSKGLRLRPKGSKTSMSLRSTSCYRWWKRTERGEDSYGNWAPPRTKSSARWWIFAAPNGSLILILRKNIRPWKNTVGILRSLAAKENSTR